MPPRQPADSEGEHRGEDDQGVPPTERCLRTSTLAGDRRAVVLGPWAACWRFGRTRKAYVRTIHGELGAIAVYIGLGTIATLLAAAYFALSRRGALPAGEVSRRVMRGLLLWTLIATLALTLWPAPHPGLLPRGGRPNLVPVAAWFDAYFPRRTAAGAVGNIGLFVPFGALLLAAYPRLRIRRVVLVAALLSTVIECLQYVFAVGRISDVNDVITNTLGGALGALVAAGAAKVFGRRGQPVDQDRWRR